MGTTINVKSEVKVISDPTTGEFVRQAVCVTVSCIDRRGVVNTAEVYGRGVNPSHRMLGKLIKLALSKLDDGAIVDGLI